jgi:starch phosphorylase
LGDLTPDDVSVQLYYGRLDSRGQIADETGTAVDMDVVGGENGVYTFHTKINSDETGDRGISVRVVPKHDLLSSSFQPNLITWA